MKKFFAIIASFALAATLLFSGCFLRGEKGETGPAGKDGINGQNVSILEIYEEAKKIPGNENLTLDQFLKDYLNYTNEELNEKTALQAVMNKSLMSGVSILSRFSYRTGGNRITYKVYTGSGVIIRIDKEKGDAYVVTNCHVVYDDTSVYTFADNVYLYLYGQDANGINYEIDGDYSVKDLGGNYRINAEVIGASVTYDIALLKITDSAVLKTSDAVAADFSNAEHAYVGETVYAVGNAAGEGLSVSDGIISKDNEYISVGLSDANLSDTNSYRVMRTTAPINHGNSGGGLFNTSGEMVGIVNAKDDEADADNLGYALPASNVRRLLNLMYDNYVAAGNLFVSGVKKAYLNTTLETEGSYSYYDTDTGRAEITETVKVSYGNGQPALSYLQYGDIIKNIKVTDGTGAVEKENVAVTRRYTVSDVMLSVREGDIVILTVMRGQNETEIKITFDNAAYFKEFE